MAQAAASGELSPKTAAEKGADRGLEADEQFVRYLARQIETPEQFNEIIAKVQSHMRSAVRTKLLALVPSHVRDAVTQPEGTV